MRDWRRPDWSKTLVAGLLWEWVVASLVCLVCGWILWGRP
jgi:hypothetical protein